MINLIEKSIVEVYEEVRVTYTEHRALFGLIKWHEVKGTDHIGNDIHITAPREIRHVYLNGDLLNPHN